MACGFWIQRARFSSVFLKVPAPMYERPPTFARFGPIIPLGASTALSEWHPTQPLARKSFSPAAYAGSWGGAGGDTVEPESLPAAFCCASFLGWGCWAACTLAPALAVRTESGTA